MLTLRKGSKGEDVKKLQTLLNCDLAIDGIFGAKTENAVKAYQAANGLKVDGVVGAQTWAKLLGTEKNKPVDYKQYDSKWANVAYTSCGNKKQTIKSSGCGPTSGADIVATWYDAAITPVETCEWSLSWGCRTKANGTSGSFFSKLANKYGGKCSTTYNMNTVIDCLNNGGLVVVCFGKSKWCTSGHYCVIWNYDGTNFYINDPASSKANRAIGTYDEVKKAKKVFYCLKR